ncbi:AraC family transcriptional regulator [Ottowia sp.]|uniref:helix-turn-helix transcriptional regulator n=1 Tax=Ottowia sp. TaxID=1898956 RepID=UPI00262E32B4|nr:AraC family transcriptional regulator [Ottowia sp.]
MPAPAPAVPATPKRLHLSSHDFAGPDKAAALREVYGRELVRVDLWPCEGAAPFDFQAALQPLHEGAMAVRCEHTPAHSWRSPALMRDGADDILLTASRAGCVIRTPGGVLEIPAGGFLLHSKAREHEYITPHGGPTQSIQLPRATLARLAPRLEEAPLRALPPGTPGTALALGYAGLLLASPAAPSASLLRTATAHLHELLAAVLAPPRRHTPPPAREAVYAARLALIQRAILARLDVPELRLEHIARLHHMTPRQVQRLFAREGTCFSDHVREQRLERAHALLADPAQRGKRVLDIALESGFNGFPAFSRAFRRRFGMTPTEVREAAKSP